MSLGDAAFRMSILHLVNDGLPTVFVLVVCLEVKREMTVGHSLGVFLAAAAAVRTGIAVKPAEYTWRQLAGAGALAGIGFTMSLFIAGQAFPGATEFSAAKIAVFAASTLSAVVGTALLWGASRQELIEEAPQSAGMQAS